MHLLKKCSLSRFIGGTKPPTACVGCFATIPVRPLCDFNTYSNSSLKWDGKQLTIDLDFPQGGKKMTWHEVWSGITATSFTQTGDMGELGGPLKRAITIHGTNLASEAASQRKDQ